MMQLFDSEDKTGPCPYGSRIAPIFLFLINASIRTCQYYSYIFFVHYLTIIKSIDVNAYNNKNVNAENCECWNKPLFQCWCRYKNRFQTLI